jgi:endonuclease/exonuclease/phosphatase family metal-dependent hydrolase
MAANETTGTGDERSFGHAGNLSLRVVTYNIWGTNTPERYRTRRHIARGALAGSPAAGVVDPDEVWRRRRALLVGILDRVSPDLIAVQEADGGSGGPPWQAYELAADLTRRGRPFEVAGFDGGLALLSRLPIRSVTQHPAQRTPDAFGGAPAVLAVDVGAALVWVAHLPVGPQEAKPATAAALRTAAAAADRPLILCGDLNWSADGPAMAELLTGGVLADAWRDGGGADDAHSAPLPDLRLRLDHVLYRPVDGWHAADAELLGAEPDADGLFPSDHCGLSVTLHRHG